MKKSQNNPRDLKAMLAREVIKMYHSEEDAKKAEEEFNKIFKNKEVPENIEEIKIIEEKINILDLLVKSNLVSSKSDAKRLIEQGGVKINSQPEKDWKKDIEAISGTVIQVGKRKFVKIK